MKPGMQKLLGRKGGRDPSSKRQKVERLIGTLDSALVKATVGVNLKSKSSKLPN